MPPDVYAFLVHLNEDTLHYFAQGSSMGAEGEGGDISDEYSDDDDPGKE